MIRRPPGNYYTVFGMEIFSGSMHEVVQHVLDWIQTKKQGYVAVTGAHGIVEASRNRVVLEAHLNAGLVVPDGMPLVWIGKAMGYRTTERIYGPDLFLALCRRAELEQWKIFLYGTTPTTLSRLVKRLKNIYPSLRIAGLLAPPFRELHPKEDKKEIRIINASNAQIVFVGLSTPKQEMWMQAHSNKIHTNVLIGVGAAFDFVAGTKRQAPRWIQRSGFEWLFRLLQEPKRLWYRYTVQYIYFFYLVLKEIFTFPKA